MALRYSTKVPYQTYIQHIFFDVSAKLASCFPDSRYSPLHYLRNFMPKVKSTFASSEVTADEVCKLLSGLPSDKATGIDNISAKLLKICAPAISRSLTHVFNKSMRCGRFLSDMKSARVINIFKYGPWKLSAHIHFFCHIKDTRAHCSYATNGLLYRKHSLVKCTIWF